MKKVKKGEALLSTRHQQFKEFLTNLLAKFNQWESFVFADVKDYLNQQKAVLLHSFMSRHENFIEYYERFFQILLDISFESNEQKQDFLIYSLYVFYETMPKSLKNNYKITLNKKNLNYILEKAQKTSKKELLFVINLLIQKKAFVLGYCTDIKNIMIKKNGEIKYEDIIQQKEQIYDNNLKDLKRTIADIDQSQEILENCQQYLLQKQKFLDQFILNDNLEPISIKDDRLNDEKPQMINDTDQQA